MHDELAARQRAISLRLAGRAVKHIWSALGRYLEAGPDGLYALTRANHRIAQRIPPELERAILSVRRRLQTHATPATRYSLVGAPAILAELKALGIPLGEVDGGTVRHAGEATRQTVAAITDVICPRLSACPCAQLAQLRSPPQLAWFLVVLPPAQLLEHAGSLQQLLEAAQGRADRLTVVDAHPQRHGCSWLGFSPGAERGRPVAAGGWRAPGP
jgi:hypothetical protein